MGYFRLSSAQEQAFQRDGYLIVRKLLKRTEAEILNRTMTEDPRIRENMYDRADTTGGLIQMSLWTEPGDDVYGLVARSRRIVDTMEALLSGEVYHYHTKLTAKEPRIGGAFEWHQDYGYWYAFGCLYPLMGACMIALDPATQQSGCFQLLKGSHHLGRIDHITVDSQVMADPQRVEAARSRLELVYCEMEPGDGLFFHCNLLHRSDPNRSPHRRWTMICAYNAARNDPYMESYLPRYMPIAKVPDDAIEKAGFKGAAPEKVFARRANTPSFPTREAS